MKHKLISGRYTFIDLGEGWEIIRDSLTVAVVAKDSMYEFSKTSFGLEIIGEITREKRRVISTVFGECA